MFRKWYKESLAEIYKTNDKITPEYFDCMAAWRGCEIYFESMQCDLCQLEHKALCPIRCFQRRNYKKEYNFNPSKFGCRYFEPKEKKEG